MYTPPSGQQPPYEPQPPYGQPAAYGQPPVYGQPPLYSQQPPRAGGKWGPSSMGMEPNITSGLAYLIGILSIIFLIMEKENRFARFHCIQSLLLRAANFVVLMIWLVVFFVVLAGLGSMANNPDQTAVANTVGTAFVLLFLCFGVIVLVDFVVTIWGMIAGFQGRFVKFPIIGNLAERWAGGPIVPASGY